MTKTKKDNPTGPAILWHSDPVGPDETVLIQGDDFAPDAVVELSRISDAAEGGKAEKWEEVTPLQRSSQCLKAVIPAGWKQGLFRCRVTQKKGAGTSREVSVNAPDVWWLQGNAGSASAHAGGWFRVLGKCLNLGGASRIALVSKGGERIEIPVIEASDYSLGAEIPRGLAEGSHEVSVHNGFGGAEGWRPGGTLAVRAARETASTVLNVLDFGADPEGRRDCTLSIVQGMERLGGLGGGVLFFPRGRYRIDSILRSGMYISHPLKIPQGVVLRGESADLVSLWWPDQKEPLPTLIEGSTDFGIEDVSIFTQGRHRNIISGESNVAIRRVRIRANCYYMTGPGGRAHHRRGVPESADAMGGALEFWGSNVEVTDCDIYSSSCAVQLKHVRGGLVANNIVRAASLMAISGGREIIFEKNVFDGNQLSSGGNGIALHFGAISCRHVYYAHNSVSHIYGGDHEALTLDGHGTAYLGRVASVAGTEVALASKPWFGQENKDGMQALEDATIYILSGRGAGQYRTIVSYENGVVRLAQPWLVEPDAESIVSIGGFNGRHLFIGNTAKDAGYVAQLYPPNCECIVAENKAIHASGINSLSKLGINEKTFYHRVEPSWFNQFLDNHVVWGNGWGGGETEVNRWIGGEGYLSIWGGQVSFWWDEHGRTQENLLTAAKLGVMLGGAEAAQALPLSRSQVVRRHRIDNNSSIRVRGVVLDVVIEKSVVADSQRGIRIDNEPIKDYPLHLDMLHFEPEPPASVPGEKPAYLSPAGILLRKNTMSRVGIPYGGTALERAEIRND